jgi:PIN domain nuclease of toxin-antitoxin system
MRPLLLDTCAAIWLAADEPLSQSALEGVEAAHVAGVALQISPVTAWEIGMLARKGRFRSHLTPQRWFEQLCAVPGVEICGLSSRIMLESSFLPGDFHGDPADRLMAATAREYGFTLVTRDRALLAYAAEGHLDGLAC